MASVTRRPLLGILLLVVAALVAGSTLSSPPWPGSGPLLGLPAAACGRMGTALAAALLGYLGAPLTIALWIGLLALSVRSLVGLPRAPWAFLGWSFLFAFVLSVFVVGVGHGPVWGSGPATLSAWLASGARLGPVGAALLTGGLLTLLVFWALPRWTPGTVQERTGGWAEGLLARIAEIPATVGSLAERAVVGVEGIRERVPSLPRPSLGSILPRRWGGAEDESEGSEEPDVGGSAPQIGAREARAVDGGARIEGGSDFVGRRRQSPVRVAPGVAAALQGKSQREGEVLIGVSGHPRDTFPDEDWDESDPELEDAGLGEGAVVDVRSTGPGTGRHDLDAYEEDEEVYEDDEDDEYEAETDDTLAEEDGIAPILIPRKEPPRPAKRPRRSAKRGAYRLPSVDLLEPTRPRLGTVSEQEVIEKSRILVKTLEDFGIQGAVGEVHPGPVITQYEYAPAAGVRISQIVSRSDDIALNMRAARIRIVAPIPGKAAIGIEVPNHQAEHIDFRSVLQELELSDAHLPLCLGRDIRGRAQYGRLEKMPHLLVAGTTGSGKSVCLNACLFSLLYNRTPDELRLLLIDPKMLELTVYDGIPHLLCPVVTDARMAARMLQWMVGEMERRYRKMATFGVRNIEGYHEKMKDKKIQREAEPMPYIVVVVDELADLMLTLGNEIETPIARLAQMARAVGIHLILATQRPSVDVITGVIKANFPGRIAFQVATKVDSRTIIDQNGAQDLLGKGDMLYLPPGQGKCVRLHGCFVSDQDAERLVQYLKDMPEPEAIFREEMLDKEGDGADIDDELFEDALRLVVYQKQASVSFLQRRLKVGYSRAGRLMDLLEGIGAVGPHEGSKPREVLADEAFLEDWLSRANSVAGS